MTSWDPSNTREIWVVDVFTDKAFRGNPAAVVFGATDLSTDQMQAIARETNLSETVFIIDPMPPAAFGLRIFTGRREIAFAVHPAVAAVHAVSSRRSGEEHGGYPDRLTASCGRNLLSFVRTDHQWFVATPQPLYRHTGISPHDIYPMLGLVASTMPACEKLDIWACGPAWLMTEVSSEADLWEVEPRHEELARLTRSVGAVGVCVFARLSGTPFRAALRAFAPAEGIYEDPVCGSCVASLAGLLRSEEAAPYDQRTDQFLQGVSVGRLGRVSARWNSGVLEVGGPCVTVMRGHVCLEA